MKDTKFFSKELHMDVKFVTTTRELVDTVPVVDGQVVTSKDNSDFFYDAGSERRRVGPCIWEPISEASPASAMYITDGMQSVIQLETNGGNDVNIEGSSYPNCLVGTVGDSINVSKIPVPYRGESYKFLGWYADAGCTAKKVETFPATFPAGKTIFYASWMKDATAPQ